MTKLYIRVPALGGKPAHWSLVSTNALGPTPDAEGLLHLRQADGSWHRHVPRNYPDEVSLRLRLKNGDWPESMRLAPTVLGTPARTYSMTGRTTVDSVPPGTSLYFLGNSSTVRFFDGSTPFMPLPYTHNPFETLPYYPYDIAPPHIPPDSTPYYVGHDPAVFYPALFNGPTTPTVIYNASGKYEGISTVLLRGAAGVAKQRRSWEVNFGADMYAPFYLFPPRLISERMVSASVADLRWVRQHTGVSNIRAVEIVVSCSYTFSVTGAEGDVSAGYDPAEFNVYLANTTSDRLVHETTIFNPAQNYYAAMDPAAKVFNAGGTSLTAARELFDQGGDVVHVANVYGDAYTRELDVLKAIYNNQGNVIGTYPSTSASGLFEYKVQLSPKEFEDNNFQLYSVYTDAVPDPADEDHPAPTIEIGISDILIRLYN